MLGYSLLAISLALAVALLAAGLRMHMPSAVPDATAEQCCWAPKGRDTRCYPCRPTRETR